jgi:chromosome segregation ATPase
MKLLANEISELKSENMDSEQARSSVQVKYDEAVDTLARFEDERIEFKKQFQEYDLARRTMHNELMDLRGRIRVFCRVRPCDGKQ